MMSTTTTFDHEWMTVSHDATHAILALRWKAATADMGTEGFQLALSLFAVEATARGARGLLVDTRAFGFAGFREVEAWRREAVIPLYNHAGVRRFAYVFPEGSDLPPPQGSGAIEAFETRYFHAHDAAEAWLRG